MAQQNIIPDDVKKTIKETFIQGFRDDIVLEVYTKPGENEQFNDAAVSLVKALGELSNKLKISYHVVGGEQAVKRNVTRTPTILIAPDKYRIRYTGAPVGEEGRSFLIALMMASTGGTILTEPAVTKINKELKEKRDIQVFVSPTCPYCPQQVLSAFSAAITKPDLVSAEAVEIYENRDLAESLGSLAVPQTFMNGTFTGAGLQPEPWFVESLLSLKEPQVASTQISGEPMDMDLVIIGGGPAGLTAAIYAERAGLKCVVIEKSNLGGQVAITPVVENYPGFMRIGGKSLVDLIAQQAAQYSQIHIGEFVTEVTRDRGDGRYSVKTNHALYLTKGIVIATGVGNRALEAQGAQKYYGRGVSYCATCDGYFFKDGKPVVVVGGGNTAVTDALYLHNIGARVTLVHRRDELRAEKRLQESFRQAGIPALWNSEVSEVSGDKIVRGVKVVDKKTNKTVAIPVDGVFVAIGYVPNNEVAKQLGLDLDDQGYIKTDLMTMRTSLPGVYAAGDITGAPKQIVVAVSHGSIAAMTAFEDLTNPSWLKMETGAQLTAGIKAE
ncbi:MAG TPA: FAD-dependent oxidoreductase [Nitrospirota bacterium]|nr:FAD-dependent oxidoreductase [Nitrospirota bacterium]